MTEMPRPTSDLAPRMTIADMQAFLGAEFPQIRLGVDYAVEAVGHGSARMRLIYAERHLRPGGTISGPAMMALADVALYVALLGAIGPVKLAVTTNFAVNFLKRPDPRDLIAHCRYLKIGRSLAVGEAELRSDGGDEAVAHVVATYSIPPRG
ncbi:thioesterase [Methylopila capsulata]|uniref:Thioesterase n=2 Tax=Methylopila capsulata TaxID=61654 RepID=A0A9W6IV22_9HYPH|nr:thioesterase [Methylopila capsulata]